MGSSTTPVNGLPPLPPGAKLSTAPPASSPSALPPLPPGATLTGAQPTANQNNAQAGGQAAPLNGFERMNDALGDAGTHFARGVGKDAVGMVEELSSLIGRYSPLAPQTNAAPTAAGDSPLDKVTPMIRQVVSKYLPSLAGDPQGYAEKTGAAASQLLQFAYGEGEARKMIEGMSFADKLSEGGKIAKMLEKYPNLARYAHLAPAVAKTAAASGAAGTGVAVAHGAGPAEALEQGAMAAGTAGLTEGVLGGVGAARENVARYQTAPKVLAEKTAAAQTAGEAKTAAMRLERQAEAQGKIKNIAQDAVRGSVGRINEARTPITVDTTIPAREGADTISEGIAIPASTVGEISGPGKTVGPNFEPINADAAAQNVGSFKDAADQVEAAAKPVYNKIDAATDGQFWKLKNQIRKGYATGDRDMVMQGTQGLDELLKQPLPGVNGTDYRAAKTAFHDSKILDRLHSVVEGSFNGISEEDAASTGIARELNVGQKNGTLRSRLGKFIDNPPKGMDRPALERVIGPDGVKGLYTASHLTSTPELAAKTKEIAEETAKEVQRLTQQNAAQFPAPAFAKGGNDFGHLTGTGVAGGIAGHMLGMGYEGGASAALSARYVLRKMVMDPAVGDMMKYAVDYGANPQRAAKTIAALITAEMQSQQEPENPEDNSNSGEEEK